MRYIATWSQIELLETQAVARLANTDHVIISEILGVLRSARRTAIKRAIKAALTDAEAELWVGLRAALEPVEKLRDELAHRIWGYSPQHPDALVLVDPKHLSSKDAAMAASLANTTLMAASIEADMSGTDLGFRRFVFPKPLPEDNRHVRMVTRHELDWMLRKVDLGVLGMVYFRLIAAGWFPDSADAAREQLSEILQALLKPLPPFRSSSPAPPPQSP